MRVTILLCPREFGEEGIHLEANLLLFLSVLFKLHRRADATVDVCTLEVWLPHIVSDTVLEEEEEVGQEAPDGRSTVAKDGLIRAMAAELWQQITILKSLIENKTAQATRME